MAIKQDPKFISAYTDRASAYEGKGDYARAMADRDAAIKLDPSNMSSYRSRGYANSYLGHYEAAAADLTRIVEKDPADAYPVLWHNVALARAGNGTALTELQVDARKLKQTEWPYPMAELFLGKRDLDSMVAAANRRPGMRGAILWRHLELVAEQPRSRHGYAEGGGRHLSERLHRVFGRDIRAQAARAIAGPAAQDSLRP